MIKVAVIGGPILSGGKKNLIMEYFRHIDKTQVQMDIVCNDDSNAIPQEEIEALGGRVFIVPSFKNSRGILMPCMNSSRMKSMTWFMLTTV